MMVHWGKFYGSEEDGTKNTFHVEGEKLRAASQHNRKERDPANALSKDKQDEKAKYLRGQFVEGRRAILAIINNVKEADPTNRKKLTQSVKELEAACDLIDGK